MGECQYSKVNPSTLGKICCGFPHHESEIMGISLMMVCLIVRVIGRDPRRVREGRTCFWGVVWVS